MDTIDVSFMGDLTPPEDEPMALQPPPTIVAYLKPVCGWSNGIRAVLDKYDLGFEDKDIINNSDIYQEMVLKSGQPLSPCVVVNGRMLADVSCEEVEAWLADRGFVEKNDLPTPVPIDRPCADEVHAAVVDFEETR